MSGALGRAARPTVMTRPTTSGDPQYDRDRGAKRPATDARDSRAGVHFVRLIPASCAVFPVRAPYSRFVRDTRSKAWCHSHVGRIASPPGAIRSTPRLHVERIAPAPGHSFPVRARHSGSVLSGVMARNVHLHRGMSRAARSVATSHKGHDGDRSRAAAPYPSARFFVCFPTRFRCHQRRFSREEVFEFVRPRRSCGLVTQCPIVRTCRHYREQPQQS